MNSDITAVDNDQTALTTAQKTGGNAQAINSAQSALQQRHSQLKQDRASVTSQQQWLAKTKLNDQNQINTARTGSPRPNRRPARRTPR